MSITHTLLRRPAKVAVAAAAAAALGGGLYGAQAANAGSEEWRSVTRAVTSKGDDNGGQIVAADTPRTESRPAPAPAIERADEPKGDDNGGQIVARDAPGIDERAAPAPADE